MSSGNAIRQQALTLSPVERAGLIEDLLASFDPVSRVEIDAAWTQEVREREEAYEAGNIPAISLEESKERIQRL